MAIVMIFLFLQSSKYHWNCRTARSRLQQSGRHRPRAMAAPEHQQASYDAWLDRARSMMDAKAMPPGVLPAAAAAALALPPPHCRL